MADEPDIAALQEQLDKAQADNQRLQGLVEQANATLTDTNNRMRAESYLREQGVSDPARVADLALPHLRGADDKGFEAALTPFVELAKPAAPAEPPPPGPAGGNPGTQGTTPADEVLGIEDWVSRARQGREPRTLDAFRQAVDSGRVAPSEPVRTAITSDRLSTEQMRHHYEPQGG